MNVAKESYVFPNFTPKDDGSVKISWDKPMEQNQLRRYLNNIVENNPLLSVNISLHSMRRGGCFFRVFESKEKRFNFRELMAWCRMADAKTCCEYLITKSLSDEIDPRNLLQNCGISTALAASCDSVTASHVADKIIQRLSSANIPLSSAIPPPASTKAPTMVQKTLSRFAIPRTIPIARSAKETWDQWFFADCTAGRPCTLQDFTKSMIKCDKRKYSERQTIGLAFSKFQSYDQFERAFAEIPTRSQVCSKKCESERERLVACNLE